MTTWSNVTVFLLSLVCGIILGGLVSDGTLNLFAAFLLTLPCGLGVGMLVAYVEEKNRD